MLGLVVTIQREPSHRGIGKPFRNPRVGESRLDAEPLDPTKARLRIAHEAQEAHDRIAALDHQ